MARRIPSVAQTIAGSMMRSTPNSAAAGDGGELARVVGIASVEARACAPPRLSRSVRAAMTNLHVLIGTASDDVDMLKKASSAGQPIDWIVPKGARPGDEAVFFVWKHGFVGSGKLVSRPVKLKTGAWAGRFRAKVDGVTWFPRPVSEDTVSKALPEWRWLRYPKGYTTPAPKVAEPLRALLDRRAETAPSETGRTFLITWNPKSWQWATLAKQAADASAGKVVEDQWSCGNRKDIVPSDRLFLIRLGEEPRGIIGSGWATSSPSQESHWDDDRAERGDLANYVRLRFDTLLDPSVDDILPLAKLRTGTLAQVHWSSQASGIRIQPEVAKELEVLWSAHLGRSAAFDDEISALEGEVRRGLILHRRRERTLRDAKIAAALRKNDGRLFCEVPGCGFDFWTTYGEIGRNYAQVHHLDPLGRRPQPRRTSLDGLAIVCANCHAMIHYGGQCRNMKSLIVRSRNDKVVGAEV